MKELNPIIEARDIYFRYPSSNEEIFRGVDVDIHPSELTLITGPSGSGKTTLLNILGGITVPNSGNVIHDGTNVAALSDTPRTEWRGTHAGYAFQDAGLMDGFSVMRNILIPHEAQGTRINAKWAGKVCAKLGIGKLLDRSPSTLSGGQKQRVALARGVIHMPEILFADEPSGRLDSKAKEDVHEAMQTLTGELGLSVVLVSHDVKISQMYADRTLYLKDGVIEQDTAA